MKIVKWKNRQYISEMKQRQNGNLTLSEGNHYTYSSLTSKVQNYFSFKEKMIKHSGDVRLHQTCLKAMKQNIESFAKK